MNQGARRDEVALIVGVGKGLGTALARRFAAGGMRIALGARSPEPLAEIARLIEDEGGRSIAVPHDATDSKDVDRAIQSVEAQLGPVGVLIYNAGNFVRGGIEDVEEESFQSALATGPFGAFLYARRLAPGMTARGSGHMIFTGATSAVMAPAHGPAFAAAKFGLRGLAMALARELGPKGIHVAHVIIDGVIDSPSIRRRAPEWSAAELTDPEGIAEAYWYLAGQGPRAWTFELDLRTAKDDYLDN